MKKLSLLAMLLFSMNLLATEVTVDDAICGEIDPFVIGDACIIMVSAPAGSKIGLVFDDYDLMDSAFGGQIETLVGKTIDVDFDMTAKIRNRRLVKALKEEMGKDYFYMRASADAISINADYKCGKYINVSVRGEEVRASFVTGGSLDLEESDESMYDFRAVTDAGDVRFLYDNVKKTGRYYVANKRVKILKCK